MKLIKAFVRMSRTIEVVQALEQVGAPGISVSRVHGVGYGYDPRMFRSGSNEIAAAPEVTKLEVVCHDDEVDSLIDAIVAAGRTGSSGDGIVFVTAVERVVRIRTGEEHLGKLHHRRD